MAFIFTENIRLKTKVSPDGQTYLIHFTGEKEAESIHLTKDQAEAFLQGWGLSLGQAVEPKS